MKKLSKSTLSRVWRTNEVLESLKQGKSREWIAKKYGVNRNTVNTDIQTLRSGFKGNVPYFIPPKAAQAWSPVKGRKMIRLMKFAKSVIEGKKSLAPKSTKPLSEKAERIIAAIRKDPNKPAKELAKDLKVSKTAIYRWRNYLNDQGTTQRLDKGILLKKGRRDPKRKTRRFTAARRKEILKGYRRRIEQEARKVYRETKAAFDEYNLLPEEIADEIEERLDWRLQTYKPSKLTGSRETKLERFLHYHRANIAFDLKRKAIKAHKNVKSLEKKSSKGTTRKQALAAKPVPVELTLKVVEKINTTLGLNIFEKAVLYGFAAKLEGKEIGKRLGYSETRIGQIKELLIKKVKRLQRQGKI